jgi:hypothetical protein
MMHVLAAHLQVNGICICLTCFHPKGVTYRPNFIQEAKPMCYPQTLWNR